MTSEQPLPSESIANMALESTKIQRNKPEKQKYLIRLALHG